MEAAENILSAASVNFGVSYPFDGLNIFSSSITLALLGTNTTSWKY
jgi:hypothetical protein